MADFACIFIEPPGLQFLPLADPIDYAAVIMPYTAIDDIAPPVASAVTVTSVPIHKSDPLVVQIDDGILIKNLVVLVKYPSGDWEGAYDGNGFSPKYLLAASGASTLTKPSSTTWVLTLRRSGGWPADPTVAVRAVDGAGNVSGLV